MFPILNRIASFSDFPQHLGLICVECPEWEGCSLGCCPFLSPSPMARGHKGLGRGTVKSTLGFVGRPRIEFWLCHLPDMGRFDTGRVPSQGLSFLEVHGVCVGVRSVGDC